MRGRALDLYSRCGERGYRTFQAGVMCSSTDSLLPDNSSESMHKGTSGKIHLAERDLLG